MTDALYYVEGLDEDAVADVLKKRKALMRYGDKLEIRGWDAQSPDRSGETAIYTVTCGGMIYKQQTGSYKDDKQEGTFRKFDEHGVCIEEGEWSEGKRKGMFIQYKDELVQRGNFYHDGQPDAAMDAELNYGLAPRVREWLLDKFYDVRKSITGTPSPITNKAVRNQRRRAYIERKLENEKTRRTLVNDGMTGCHTTEGIRGLNMEFKNACVQIPCNMGRSTWRHSTLLDKPGDKGGKQPADSPAEQVVFTPAAVPARSPTLATVPVEDLRL